jgi:oligopeptide transport system ATP-binding protein
MSLVQERPTGSLLEIRNLRTEFRSEGARLKAVDDVSLSLGYGDTLGIVGESGCGKSVTALSIMRLVPSPPAEISGGEILFEGEDLLMRSPAKMREIRGGAISMIFQEPMTSLNPILTVGSQIVEAIRLHQRVTRREARQRAVEALRLVSIPSPERRVDDYPHQLSGGMRQRAMIAMALSCQPKLLLADEPTTALDVTIQAQILDLIEGLQERFHMAVILITHDLGVVAEVVRRVAVMYAGRIVEQSEKDELFLNPLHPYTRGLLNSIPKLDQESRRLRAIQGRVPTLHRLPKGCSFNPRCAEAKDICREKPPDETEVSPGHRVRCWLWEGVS